MIMKRLWILILALAATGAQADWSLDGEHSAISFVSVKNVDVAEAHSFGVLRGEIDADGAFAISIELDSVDTQVPIRDERMRKELFETTRWPLAVVSGRVAMADYSDLDIGESKRVDVPLSLALHGTTSEYVAHLRVARTGEHALEVSAIKPIIVNAASLGLGDGVERLKEIAGLQAISKAVPVYFVLRFQRKDSKTPV
jgi:polyisoprenoid-binding protein YceI